MNDLAEPRANPLLLGQEAAEARLLEAVRHRRLHHAWLLLGPPGIGKATLAFRFARRLLAGGDFATLDLPSSHPVFHRVAAGTHADLLTIERGFDPKRKKLRTEIVVDDVREISQFMHLTPAEAGWRVAIIDGAEDLNRNAANALLKILEEPPPRAILVVCSSVGRVLPTIRSRCRRLDLMPLAEPLVADLLARARPDMAAAEHHRLAALAGGSVGRAIALADDGGLALHDLAASSLAKFDRLTTRDALRVWEAMGREDDAFSTMMDMLRDGFSARVRAAARGGDRALAERPLGDLVAAWSALGRLQGATEGLHLDKREALVQGFAVLAGRTRPDAI